MKDAIKAMIQKMTRRKKLFFLGIGVSGLFGLAIPAIMLGGSHVVGILDSSAFCTQVCHDVHYAEATTYDVSAHSEVACASCHVGAGTGNLISSKLRGLKDIVPQLTHSYDLPIKTPLNDRRPSSETCEKCHYAEKFYGDIPQIKTTYGTDQLNTRSTVTHVLKVGGGLPEVGSGIHWHSTAKVWYVALDPDRKKIAWVASENVSGTVTEYVDPELIKQLTPAQIESQKLLMDCVDCHNRTPHNFQSPDQLIDAAISNGSIDPSLPFIKREGLKALVPQNTSLDEANSKIQKIADFYKTSYPKTYSENRTVLDKAIGSLKDIAKQTTFSDINWNTYGDNSKHDEPDSSLNVDWQKITTLDDSAGCFRCHGNLSEVNGKGIEQGADVRAILMNIGANITGSNVTQGADFSSKSSSANVTPPTTARPIGPLSGNVTAPAGKASGTISANATGNGGPGPGYLKADCDTCHYTYQTDVTRTTAPATPHPIDGLDDCLVCHAPNAAEPFKSTHPWSTNEACSGCHQTAPKLKTLATGQPPAEAKDIPHPTKGLKDCLVCHGPAGTNSLKNDHPWSSDDTCSSCHKLASVLKPLPSTTPPAGAKAVTHPTAGLESCLVCHATGAPKAFPADHPWSTNDACTACHQVAPSPVAVAAPSRPQGPVIPHPGYEFSCTTCHSAQHGGIPAEYCSMCHAQSPLARPVSLGSGPSGSAPPAGSSQPAGGQTPPGPTVDAASLYSTYCASCHGASRQGVGSNPPVTASALASRSVAQITAALTTGTMSPYASSFTPAQIDAMATWLKGTAPTTPPAAPSTLAATAASATRINLTWVDTATNETGYRVERATNSTFTTGFTSFVVTGTSVVSYADSTVSASTPYYYRVFATNAAGDSLASNTTTATTPAAAGTVPAAPGSLAATAASATQVDLTWVNNAANASGYRVERATNSTFTTGLTTFTVAAASTLSYSDTTASGSTAYYYRVIATNSSGSSSASNTASVTTPAAPIDPTALYSTYCASCHGASRQGVGSNPPVTATSLASRSVAQITAALTTGTMSPYASSFTPAQIDAMATWLKGTAPTTPPAAPSTLAATAASATRINLTWVDTATNETGYRVERATNSTFTTGFTSFVVTGTSVVSYADSTVSASTPYYYRVFATNAAGDSLASNTTTATTPAAAGTVPAAPGSLAATAASATQVDLTWVNNAANASGYRVERATNSTFTTGLTTFTVAAASTLSYSDTTASGSTAYYYRVIATNSSGSSSASNTASVTTPAAPIDPTALYSTYCASCHGASRQGVGSNPPVTASALASRSVAQITAALTTGTMSPYASSFTPAQIDAMATWLKGTAPTTPPAAPSTLAATAASATRINLTWVDTATNETGYRVERATNSTFTTGFTSFVVTGTSVVSYADSTVSASTPYYYRVFATNAAGDSLASNTTTATTPAAAGTVPAAPGSLAATAASATQVDLTWVNNAANASGYRVERATNSTFTTGLTTFTVAAASTLSYSDTTASGSTAYYYRVIATNSSGSSSASNTASVTTPAAPIDPTALYSTYCASCHGASRQGVGSNPPVTASALAARSVAQITAALTTGTMSPYASSFTPAQIDAMATWLKGSASPIPAPTPTPTPTPTPAPTAPPIAHTTTGYTQCLVCHASISPVLVPTDHAGRTNSTCATCHQSSGITSAPMLSVGAPSLGHALDSQHQDCLSCHGPGKSRAFPSSHNGYQNLTCTVCHRAQTSGSRD